MSRYFEIEAEGGTLRVPYDDAPEALAKNVSRLKPAYVVEFLESLAEELGELDRAAVAEQFGQIMEHKKDAILELFGEIAPGGGQ